MEYTITLDSVSQKGLELYTSTLDLTAILTLSKEVQELRDEIGVSIADIDAHVEGTMIICKSGDPRIEEWEAQNERLTATSVTQIIDGGQEVTIQKEAQEAIEIKEINITENVGLLFLVNFGLYQTVKEKYRQTEQTSEDMAASL